MALSALDDLAIEPTDQSVAGVLGAAIEPWKALLDWLEKSAGINKLEWRSSRAKYGWSLSVLKGKRTIVYLIPQHGRTR